MKKYKKFLILLVTSVLLFALMFVKAAGSTSAKVYNIVTCPGEDMSCSMQINWQADMDLNNLDLEYSIDPEFKDALRIDGGEPKVFKRTDGEPKSAKYSGMKEPRLVYNVVLTALEPKTKYQYRIVNGTEVLSDVYRFETAGKEMEEFSFLFMTDPQYATEANSRVFNQFAEARILDSNIKFCFLTGDITDRGGSDQLWRWFFDKSSLKKLPYVSTVGNHEYYDTGTVTIDNSIYNNYWFNPQNGPDPVKGSCYWCLYNTCLFVMLDSEIDSRNPEVHRIQEEWFRNVCKSVPCSYLIVGEHRSAYAGANYYEDGRAFLKKWGDAFDDCAVDLVLSGHDHIFARTKRLYQDRISYKELQGTTYILGGAAGWKHYRLKTEANKPKWACQFQGEPSCTVITLGKEELSTKTYNLDGEIKDHFSQKRKRFGEVDPDFSKDVFMNSITLSAVPESKTEVIASWDKNAYGNVQSISFVNETKEDNKAMLGSQVILNESSTEKKIAIMLGEVNKICAIVHYYDGTDMKKAITFDNTIDWGSVDNFEYEVGAREIVFKWNQNFNQEYYGENKSCYIQYIQIYRDDFKAKMVMLKPEDLKADSFTFNLDRKLEPEKSYDIKVELINVNNIPVKEFTINVTMTKEITEEERYQNEMANVGIKFLIYNVLNLID